MFGMKLECLQTFRKDNGLSQRECADRVDVERETWARWESGNRQIGDEHLPRVVELTGIAPDVLRPDKAQVWRREAAE